MPKYVHYYVCKCKEYKEGSGKYVIEESESAEPTYEGLKHQKFQYEQRQERQKKENEQRQKEKLQKKGGKVEASGDKVEASGDKVEATCWETLQWKRTEERGESGTKQIAEADIKMAEPEKKGVSRTVQDSSTKYGIELVMKRASTTKVSTVAAMWDPGAGVWYQGSCRHNLGEGTTKIPSRIAQYICKLKPDNSDWAFGWNCAEVQCIANAYKKGKKDTGDDAPLRGCLFIACNNKKSLYGGCRTCQDWIKKFGGVCYNPNV
jgi:hypothetical protein